MLINSIYETANVLLNKDQRGKISPFEFNRIAQQAQRKITNELLSDYKKLILRKVRFNLGSGFADQSHFTIQAIEYYIKSKEIENAKESILIDSEIWYLNEIYNEETLIEKVENNHFNTLKRSGRMRPSQCLPICTMMGGNVLFFPEQGKIEIQYLRKPKEPKWTFIIENEIPMYNPDAKDFSDFDVHHDLISPLLIEILQMCGLNLREADIEQYITQMKQEAMAKQNSM